MIASFDDESYNILGKLINKAELSSDYQRIYYRYS